MEVEKAGAAHTDPAGWETLELFAAAPLFNRWLFETIQPYCAGSVLEIGSGIGNISAFLLEQGSPVTLSDLREEYCRVLREKFARTPGLQDVRRLDLATEAFEEAYPSLLQRFDSIVALNVVEHIGQDRLAIANCRKMLKPGGRLIILVPAYSWLYNSFDRELGHFRRYNKTSLRALLEEGGLTAGPLQYFNLAGIAGWWWNGNVLRKKTIPGGQLHLYNRLVPLMRLADRLAAGRTGLSVIAIGTN